MIRKLNKKIVVLLLTVIGLFSFLLKGVTAYAEESIISNTGLAPGEDPAIYNTEWTQAKVNYWLIRSRLTLFGGIRTISYIRITDQKDEFITGVTRLKACYKIDGKDYLVNKEISNKGNQDHIFSVGNIASKEGQFTNCSKSDNEYCMKKDFKDFDKADSEFKECNFKWMWNYKVTEIVYLYVWYLNPETGREVAASFMPDGAHPLYDENGILKGIYDADGNPLKDYSMGADGIIADETGKDIITPADQFVGEIENVTLFKTASDSINNFLDTMLQVFILMLGVVVFMVLIWGVSKIISWFKK